MKKLKLWIGKNKATVRALLAAGLIAAGVGPVVAPLLATVAVESVEELPET